MQKNNEKPKLYQQTYVSYPSKHTALFLNPLQIQISGLMEEQEVQIHCHYYLCKDLVLQDYFYNKIIDFSSLQKNLAFLNFLIFFQLFFLNVLHIFQLVHRNNQYYEIEEKFHR